MASCRSEIDLSAITRVLREVTNDQPRNTTKPKRIIMASGRRRQAESISAAPRPGQIRPTRDSLAARAIRETRLEAISAFPAGIISDPGFDMLLDLFIAQEEGERRHISQLVKNAGIPSTTTLRWLSRLEDENIIQRRPDFYDERKTYIELTEDALAKFRNIVKGSAKPNTSR